MPEAMTERWSLRSVDEARQVLSRRFGPVQIASREHSAGELELNMQAHHARILMLSGHSASGFDICLENRCAAYVIAVGRDAPIKAVMDRPSCDIHYGRALLLGVREIKTWQVNAGGFDCVVFPVELLNRRLSRLLDRPLIRSLVFKPADLSREPCFAQIVELVRVICGVFESESLLAGVRSIRRGFEDILLDFMLQVLPHNHSQLLKPCPSALSPRHVRRAVAYIHSHARQAERVRLEDIAEAAKVSVRSLQTGFSSAKGMPPMAYLRMVKLQGARAELSAVPAPLSVADVAAAWGFSHSGVFSRLYRTAFGELPSQTIKRVEHG